ncbi:MAG: PIN domain-containing protein [Anaerolineales bacterium]|nr:PIN domain-containing protein [Anaerolineales bacterium]
MSSIFADASVLVAGAGSRTGASRAVLVMAEIGLYRLVVCRQVLDEAERNLRKKLPGALPVFAELMAAIGPEILPDPSSEEVGRWQSVIELKDAPILAAAVTAAPDRFLTLDVKNFIEPAHVAEKSGLRIETPAEFVQAIRALVEEGLSQPGESPIEHPDEGTMQTESV